MAFGRPSKFSKKILYKTRKYIKEYRNSPLVVPKNVGTQEKPFLVTEINYPTRERLALELGIGKTTLYDWLNPESPYFKKDFSELVDVLDLICIDKLKQGGLGGTFQTGMARLLLGNLGIIDQNRTTDNKEPETNNFFVFLDTAAKQLNEGRNEYGIEVGGGQNVVEAEVKDVSSVPFEVPGVQKEASQEVGSSHDDIIKQLKDKIHGN